MSIPYLVDQMAHRAEAIRALTLGVSEEQARWKPDAESWSILEVINHLYDEEREDFRMRVDYTLHRPGEPWPPIDPAGWVTQRQYNSRDLAQSVAGFMQERDRSLVWLRGLQAPDWQIARAVPWGQITAGDVMAAWAAHDALHLRQVVTLHYAWIVRAAQPYQVVYAGEW